VVGDPQGEGFTFLFTDIEGSSRLWDRVPDAMAPALARHDHLVVDAIRKSGGEVFKMVGDGVCAIFQRAGGAPAAALEVQRALAGETWGRTGPLRVRIAIHSGDASTRGGDYFGPSLNRVARLLQLAHGGQILLSGSARALAREDLPAGAALIDLGIHALRDLTRPEHVYQLEHPDLPVTFPPLRSHAIVRNNLPASTTSFVGREREIAALKEALAQSRLVTITGLGGAGKTRTALRLAETLLPEFADGVWFAELAALTHEPLVPQTVSEAVGLQREGVFSSNHPWLARLCDALEDKHLLLVLDNCEHVIGACAELADALLRRCRHVRIVATSRENLSIEGEHIVPLAPLPVPAVRRVQPADAARSDAVELFVQRARAHRPQFTVTDDNLPAIVEICQRLDGIPLALELAAARVGHLSVEEVAARLGDLLSLRGGGRGTPERHRSMRAMLDWSEELLPDAARALFHRLSVFRGAFTVSTVEATCSAPPLDGEDLLDLVGQLVDRSMVRARVGVGETRYWLLETVRQYAGEKLEASGEAADTARRHGDHYLHLVEEAEPELEGVRQTRWVDQLESEIDEIRAAFERAIADRDAELALRLTGPLWYFWFIRGHLSEGRRWIERALSLVGDAAAGVRAKALAAAGVLTVLEDPARAEGLLLESFELAERQGDRGNAALACFGLGWRALYAGDLERMRWWLEHSRREFEAIGATWGVGLACAFLCAARDALGDHDGGDAAAAEALESFRLSGDRLGGAYARVNYGEVLRARNEDELASHQYEEALAVFREVDERTGAAIAALNLGMVLIRRGELERATDLLCESLAFVRDGSQVLLPVCLAGMGGLAVARGELMRSAALFGAADSAGEAIGAGLQYADRVFYDEQVAALRASLPDSDLAAAWESGRVMTSRDAIAFALESGSRPFQRVPMYAL
jgi:predicted ATPase/class 3 adenylate cyclase